MIIFTLIKKIIMKFNVAFGLLFLLNITSIIRISAQSKPNVVFIFADDLTADALGCYDNKIVKTPNIDKIASAGTKFTNAYILGGDQGAICSPSRCMLMTGKSYFKISNKLKNEYTLPKAFKNNGYTTFMTGKWHNEEEGIKEGFDHAKNIMFGGMDNHFSTRMQDLNKDGSFSEIEQKGFSTDVFTDSALSFLNDQNEENPFFMYVSYTAPHDPRSPKLAYQNMYDPKNIPIPTNFLPFHPFSFGHSMGIRDELLASFPRTTSEVKAQIADYYGLISHLDDAVGQLIEKLKEKKLFENTIIVFASDNGLAIGSHGLMGKQNMYEHSMKVPLIFSGPGIPKNINNKQFVYLLDVFPTFTEMLGLVPPKNIDGKSFHKNMVNNKIDVTRKTIFTGYLEHQRAIRDDRFKLIVYPKINHSVLYDLQTDPYELKDISKSNPNEVNKLLGLMVENQIQFGDTLSLTSDFPLDKKWDYKDLKRVPDKWQPEYILNKYFNTN
jgi:arylsulfatase A-like enzyme